MWIVELALRRPYTFVVVALLIAIMSIVFMFATPKDIFPHIDIPIISVIWQYNGLPAEEFSERITTYSEYSLFNNVNDIERMESQTLTGVGIITLFFHPGAEISVCHCRGDFCLASYFEKNAVRNTSSYYFALLCQYCSHCSNDLLGRNSYRIAAL